MKTPNKSSDVPSENESARLRELVREIGLPLARLPEVTSLKPEESLKWWSNQNPGVTFATGAFGRIAELVAIDENQLFTGNYDRELARRRLLGDHNALPAKYLENQNSFLRTSAHIMKYVALTRGQAFADQVLYELNVSPLIYRDLNTKINLTYFSDLLGALERKGFSQGELDTLASVMFLSMQETALGQSFEAAKCFFDIYSTLANSFDYFDSNFEYKSDFVGKKYVLKTTLPLAEHELLLQSPQDLERLLRYRHILLAWFPYLAGLAPLFPKSEFARKGDFVESTYEFDLTPAASHPKKLFVV